MAKGDSRMESEHEFQRTTRQMANGQNDQKGARNSDEVWRTVLRGSRECCGPCFENALAVPLGRQLERRRERSIGHGW